VAANERSTNICITQNFAQTEPETLKDGIQTEQQIVISENL
jgi:hypothetical protein